MREDRDDEADNVKAELERAESTLLHMEDIGKIIAARAPVVHKETQPWRDRLVRNHFIQEYEELFRGNR